jgi:hypothetical protein
MPSGTKQELFLDNQDPQLTNQQIGEFNATQLTKYAGDIQKGSAAASQAARLELHEMMKDGGYLPDMTKALEQSGDAKIVRGTNGELQHIVFNGTDGKPPVDIDVQNDAVNGQSQEQMRDASIKQGKDYMNAALADPNMTDASGKPLSPEAQKQAGQLVGGLLDGNSDATTQAAQEIMKDPNMTKSVGEVLNRIQMPGPITFDVDDKGQPYMKADCLNEIHAMIVPATGTARASNLDYTGKEEPNPSADLKSTMREASDWALTETSRQVQSAEGHLTMVDRLPKDGFTNMKGLEREYTSRHDDEDGAKLKDILIKDIQKLTPEERAIFRSTT